MFKSQTQWYVYTTDLFSSISKIIIHLLLTQNASPVVTDNVQFPSQYQEQGQDSRLHSAASAILSAGIEFGSTNGEGVCSNQPSVF